MISRAILAALLAFMLLARPASAAPFCVPLKHQGSSYTVCRVDLQKQRIRLFWGEQDGTIEGTPLASLGALADRVEQQRKHLLIGMNAGMFAPDLKPVGLYVEAGRVLKPANTLSGEGNFHLKPNGVFYLAGSRAGVIETGVYLKAGIRADYATQSGPMLVIEGRIHPRFDRYARSQKIRNGVGVTRDGKVMLVISRSPVTLPGFAHLFRDALGCSNALYLDGSVSSLVVRGDAGDPALEQGGYRALGPMIGVTAR